MLNVSFRSTERQTPVIDTLTRNFPLNMMYWAVTDNGFEIVYDKDLDVDIADGFYFTFSYPGMTGIEMLDELVYYGISAISLNITGSKRTEGARACVSLVSHDQLPDLPKRLKAFQKDHPVK